MEHPYFEWLLAMPGFDKRYRKIMDILFTERFRWLIDIDEDRAEDGKDLRYEFANEFGYGSMFDYLDTPCNCAEVIIALARRHERQWDNPKYGDRTWVWVQSMLDSLGLHPGISYDSTLEIIDRWLDRRFNRDGSGSLFTIPNSVMDMRKIDIWRQSNLWFALMDD